MIAPVFSGVTISGKRLAASDALALGITVDIKPVPHADPEVSLYDLSLVHRGADAHGIESVELSFSRESSQGAPIPVHRFYKEGLTVVGVSGARGRGDCDFELDPSFLNFTVSDPVRYRWDQSDQFCAEQVAVMTDAVGAELLAGFVTANRFFCRIIWDGGDPCVAGLKAVVDLDGTIVVPGSDVRLETLMVKMGRDVETLLNGYARQLGAAMNAVPGAERPSGWCSYYFYYGQETEADILENARFLADHQDTIPVKIVQIDDGWQQARGSWLEANSVKYPHGMSWLAGEVRRMGFRPGIWIAPFLVSESASVYRDHPDWLLRDKVGSLLKMGGDAILDPTHPEALRWLTGVFKTMRDWGYDYFKLDFMMVATCHGAHYHDASMTRVQAYRKGLQAIRDAVGADTYLLGGTSLVGPNVGLVNGCRIATDVTPYWCKRVHTPESPAIFNVCRNIINRGYMNGKLWNNDPDCLIVREYHGRPKYKDIASLTMDETLMLASAMILSGGGIFLGDRLSTLPAERLGIIRTVLSLANGVAAWPVDRMEREIPYVWFRTGEGSLKRPHLLGLFNWDDTPRNVSVSQDRLGLSETLDCYLVDVWSEGDPVAGTRLREMVIPPHTCKLFKIITED